MQPSLDRCARHGASEEALPPILLQCLLVSEYLNCFGGRGVCWPCSLEAVQVGADACIMDFVEARSGAAYSVCLKTRDPKVSRISLSKN